VDEEKFGSPQIVMIILASLQPDALDAFPAR
jgi:hypothetical protein